METITDFLFTCFKTYGYEIHWRCQNLNFIVLKHSVYNDFWILTSEFDINELQKQLSAVYEDNVCSEYPSALKNTSLLYVKNQNTVNLDKEDNCIIEIENNPYHFKKYVLAYTDAAFNNFIKLFEIRENEFSISKELMKKDNFEKLKEENSFGPYHLLYSIAHKLPFAVIDVVQKKFDSGDPIFTEEEDSIVESLSSYDERDDVNSMLKILNREIEADENK
jgi:hypothetical protein